MIEQVVERMYAEIDDNRFLEVTYANGDKEVLYFKDFNSGAMIQNIVDRAKKYAIKAVLETGTTGLRVQHLLDSIVDEFAENEDLPNTTNPDDWARISGQEGRADRLHPHAGHRQERECEPRDRHRVEHRPVPVANGSRHRCPGICRAPVSWCTDGVPCCGWARGPVAAVWRLIDASSYPDCTARRAGAGSSITYSRRYATDHRDRGRVRHLVAVRPDREPDPHLHPGGAGLRGGGRDPARQAHPLGLRGGVAAARRPRVRPEPRRRARRRSIDADEVGAANMILTNGARLYVDHAHPEYSAPEVTDPLDAVIWDKAGERVMEAAARHVASVPGAAEAAAVQEQRRRQGRLLRHARELPDGRQTPFSAVIAGLTPFLVSRQVVTGSGRVGHRAVRRRARLPAVPARRLHRGRGRPGDHAQARHHQHPRRAARRRRQVPPAARHHRRRQPRRDVDVPEGRHHRAGARPDRGGRRIDLSRSGAGPAGARGARRSAATRRCGRPSRWPTVAS